MISCSLNRVKRVLCLGAHSDDIEIGCGGTILQLLQDSDKLELYWLVFCSNPERAREAEVSANAFLRRRAVPGDYINRQYFRCIVANSAAAGP